MLTSKQRAELRSQANGLETTLIVGKEGVTDMVIREAENLLSNRELVKGKVLETSLLSAREACDAICEAIGAEVGAVYAIVHIDTCGEDAIAPSGFVGVAGYHGYRVELLATKAGHTHAHHAVASCGGGVM